MTLAAPQVQPEVGPHALTPRQTAHLLYAEALDKAKVRGPHEVRAVLRYLASKDLFYLLVYILGRGDADRDWIFDRCREVQAAPDGHLDLWSREHYKSSVITFALTIQDILNYPERTHAIFSRSRSQAIAFLKQIKQEFENNKRLKELFPNVLWAEPEKDAPTWSLMEGLIVKRKGNPKEATLEAWGLIDGQPTGRHFDTRIYDDIIDKEAVTSEDMIESVTKSWELSLSLGKDGGRERYIGTHYHHRDTYAIIIERNAAIPRIHAATKNSEPDGEPVLLTKEYLRKIYLSVSNYTFATQYLLDPTKGSSKSFDVEWLRYWRGDNWTGMNIYVLVDAANAKKKKSDYTAMWVMGLGRDRNIYVVDGVRDKLDLGQRTRKLFQLVDKYRPIAVGYEEYGLMADVAHIKSQMELVNYHFEIKPLGGNVSKDDRIGWLIPLAKQGRLYLPYRLPYETIEGQQTDLVQTFVNFEWKQYPLAAHEDMLDCMARIEDPMLHAEAPMGGQMVGAVSGQAETTYDIFGH